MAAVSGLRTKSLERNQVYQPVDVRVIVDNKVESFTPINDDEIEIIYQEEPVVDTDKSFNSDTADENSNDIDDFDDTVSNIQKLIGTKGGRKQTVCIQVYKLKLLMNTRDRDFVFFFSFKYEHVVTATFMQLF